MQEDPKRKLVAFPLFGLDVSTWSSNEETNKKDKKSEQSLPIVAIGGGGGSSKTGIVNEIIGLQLIGQKSEGADLTFADLDKVDLGPDAVKCIQFHPTERLLACGAGNGCRIFQLKENKFKMIHSFQTDFATEYSEQKTVKFSPNGKNIATGGADGVIRLFDLQSCKKIAEFSDEKVKEDIDDLEFDPSGKFIYAITQTSIKVFKINEPLKTRRYILKEEYQKKKVVFRGLRFFRDHLYTGKIAPGYRSWILKWKVDYENDSWKLVSQNILHRNTHHNALCFSPKGDFIATGTGEGTVAVFETKSSSKVMDVKSHTFFVTKVAFTPDSKYVLSVSADYSCLVQPVKISRQLDPKIILLILSIIVALLAFLFNFMNK